MKEKLKKIFNALSKLPMPFGFSITTETDFSGGDKQDSGRKSSFYCEIDPSTGALVTDRRFGRLPFALKMSFNYDPKYTPYYNCEKQVEGITKGELDARLIIDSKTVTKEMIDFVTQYTGKEYAVLFSQGESSELGDYTVGQTTVERRKELMYFVPRVMFNIKYNPEMPDKKAPTIEAIISRPLASITLPAYVTGSLNPALPLDIEDLWGLEPTKFANVTWTVYNGGREFDLQECIKTT